MSRVRRSLRNIVTVALACAVSGLNALVTAQTTQNPPGSSAKMVPARVLDKPFSIEDLTPLPQPLEPTRQAPIFLHYMTVADEKERVALAADYLYVQRLQALGPAQREALQQAVNRVSPGTVLGSLSDRRANVELMLKFYDEATTHYGPAALSEWYATAQDPVKMTWKFSSLMTNPSWAGVAAQFTDLGKAYVFDQTVAAPYRRLAIEQLSSPGLTATLSTRLGYGIATLANPTTEYGRLAPEVLKGFVGERVLEYFGADSLLVRITSEARDRYNKVVASVPATRSGAGPSASFPTFDSLLTGRVADNKDYLGGIRTAIDALTTPPPKAVVNVESPEQFERRLQGYANAHSVVNGISGILSLDPKTRWAGQSLARISDVTFSLADACARRTKENAPLMAAGVVGLIVVAAITVIEVMGDQNAANSELAAIGGMLSQISAQIATLQTQMHGRFDRVDLRLDIISSQLREMLGQFLNKSDIDQHAVMEIRGRLDRVVETLDTMSRSLNEIPDRVSVGNLDASLNQCIYPAVGAAADQEACGRQLLTYLMAANAESRRSTVRVPGATASGPELRRWIESIREDVPSAAGSKAYPVFSMLRGLANLDGGEVKRKTPDQSQMARITALHPVLFEHLLDQYARLGRLSPELEAQFRSELNGVLDDYKAMHAHFRDNFDAYSAYLLARYEAYRKEYAGEMGRIFAEAATSVSGGLVLAPARASVERISAGDLNTPGADAALAAKRINACRAQPSTTVTPEDLDVFAGTYDLPASLRRVNPLYRVAESLSLGHLELVCYEATGNWRTFQGSTTDMARSIYFEQQFPKFWRYRPEVKAMEGVEDFAETTTPFSYQPPEACINSCPAFFDVRSARSTPAGAHAVHREAWKCALRNCQAAPLFQNFLNGTRLTQPDKDLEKLRAIVAGRLIDWRARVLPVVAQRATAAMQAGRGLNHALQGMAAFKLAVEQLAVFVNERSPAVTRSIPIFESSDWLVGDTEVREAVETGDTLDAFLTAAAGPIAGGTIDQTRGTRGSLWLQALKVGPKAVGIESVFAQPRSWVQLFDPQGMLDAARARPPVTASTSPESSARANEVPEFMSRQQGKLIMLETIRGTAPR